MLFGPLLRWHYMSLVPVLKMKMLQIPVTPFDSLNAENMQHRPGDAAVQHLGWFSSSFIYTPSYFPSPSFHTWTIEGVGGVTLTPALAWVLGRASGGAARCTFSFVFISFSWSKPWLCMETELGTRCRAESTWWGASCVHRRMILNECQHLPPQAALNLCLSFLDFLWSIVCLCGRHREHFSPFLLRLEQRG